MSVFVVEHVSYEQSVREAFEGSGGPAVVDGREGILLKPNLVTNSPFPITTHPDFVGAVIDVLREHTDASIVVAEGCGSSSMETGQIFAELGYEEMAGERGVELVDLNHAPQVHKTNPACSVFPEMWLPEMAFTHCIISLPVIKAHSLATITGTMKNMMGFPPPSHYQGGGAWKKSAFHARMQTAVKDLCSYIMPDLTIMDATVGMADYHLGGATCEPPIGKLLAGTDAVALDRMAAELLGHDWRSIGHLS